MRACFKNRPVRGPGLQEGPISASSCRPRAHTRRDPPFLKRALRFLARAWLCLIVVYAGKVPAAEWVRAGLNTNQPLWGIRGGLLWAIAPAGFRGGEPRGLIRLGYPILAGGGYDLINFIAIEPIVHGHRGFSELEQSKLDGVPGKRIWPENGDAPGATNLWPGRLSRTQGKEELEVALAVEKFDNGAHVRVVARQRSERPDELELVVFKEQDSEPLDYCILTATMGNMARTRQLWLKDRVVSSLELYRTYKEADFAPHRQFGLNELKRSEDGDVRVAVTTDEQDPAAVFPFPGSEHWHYAGTKVTQFWRVPAVDVQPDLQAIVNGRYMYWRSQQPVPGGIAFENFELRQKFRPGLRFIFGITRTVPKELGF